ncbi:MAG: sugar phosphorylase [Kiritimatiellae bacterium]|nr:sugar phosphorylase [Kiritimatiellia bacterium]
MNFFFRSALMDRLYRRFRRLYGRQADNCISRLAMLVGRYGLDPLPRGTRWSQKTALLIAYGDMVAKPSEKPLAALKKFLDDHIHELFSHLHLLPFFPYSSDDGFSVVYYRSVNPDLGDLNLLRALAERYGLAVDLVLNHVSAKSGWFQDFIAGVAPGRHYFIEADPAADYSKVIRPRNTPLLTPVAAAGGVKHVWTTFSADQIDLNYANPDVLFELLDILLLYISLGARVIRLDAIAYLWKKTGTPCIHLEETHEIVRLMRDFLELTAPGVLLLTETNVPHNENVAYFGTGDEAHLVYQFSLPPLILHALASGNARFLTKWAAALASPPAGCAFINFTASHDGIGLFPLQGLVPEDEIASLVDGVLRRGGKISSRSLPDCKTVPYELNCAFFDALAGPAGEPENIHCARFLCSQAIMLGLKGIPAVYFNSLFAAGNDYELAEKTGQPRSLNRGKWDDAALRKSIADPGARAGYVFSRYAHMLEVRARHAAFHPDGDQRVLDLGGKIFAVERKAPDGTEYVLAVSNVSGEKVRLSGAQLRKTGIASGQRRNLLQDDCSVDLDGELCLEPYETVWLAT